MKIAEITNGNCLLFLKALIVPAHHFSYGYEQPLYTGSSRNISHFPMTLSQRTMEMEEWSGPLID